MEAAVLVADHGNGAAVDVLATQTLIDEPLIDESVRVSE